MKSSRPSQLWIWLLLAAAGVMLLPADTQAKVRVAVADLLKPGCHAWRAAPNYLAMIPIRWPGSQSLSDATTVELRQQLDAAEQRVRRLEVELARHQEVAAAHQPPLFAQQTDRTVERIGMPVLIEAAVWGDAAKQSWKKGAWLDQGKDKGLIEEAPILASGQSLVDVGRDARLSAEDALLLGRSVIGKVQQVGRWTSTILWVTDADYRGRAQLVRAAGEGYVFGAKGILKGQGETLCRLDGIPAAESVEVGDSVYTADRDGVLPTPLFYGTVVEAELEDRAREWRVLVQPATRPPDLTHVQVLRSAVNPRRALAN